MMTKRGIQWLSAAAEDPHQCRELWAADPRAPHALEAGRYFDVVVIGQRVGMETFEQLVRHNMPMGPVMLDRYAKLTGFFLPSHQRGRFAHGRTRERRTAPLPLTGHRRRHRRARTHAAQRRPVRLAARAHSATGDHTGMGGGTGRDARRDLRTGRPSRTVRGRTPPQRVRPGAGGRQ